MWSVICFSGKDNLEVAAKFLEGAVHELQALYDAAEAPEQVRIVAHSISVSIWEGLCALSTPALALAL